ncbi:MAG: SPFH domain-containing protein [Clostridiales bacterium]|nr:SPFH domain-containing protein [Clostridiales bacterium]
MGFFGKQLLDVIEWKDVSNDVMVYRYFTDKREEIMNSSTLIVRESQVAIFVHKGEVADVFGPGTYKLATENIPFLTKMLSLPTGGNSRIKAEIYFVNTKRFMGLKWGTQNPIMMRDVDFGNIRLRGYGTFAIKVNDPVAFMRECFGTNAVYRVGDIVDQYKSTLVQLLTDAIGESKLSALDLAAHYKDISKIVEKHAKEEFGPLGLQVTRFVIENLSLPEDVEKMLDERTKLGVIADKMGTYTQFKAANAMGDAANNPNGSNMAGLGIGVSAGMHVGEMFNESVRSAKDSKRQVVINCAKCGASIPGKSKFCPECGATQALSCPKCGEPIRKNSKFCSSCGEKLLKSGKVCSKCGKELDSNAKFCPDCGTKL